ncbi:MAG: DUF6688 family protein [Planctomycetota bacterium]
MPEIDPILEAEVVEPTASAPLGYASPRSEWVRRPRHVLLRVVLTAFGIGYPIFGLVLNQRPSTGTVMVGWQNGKPLAWVTMLPMLGALWPLVPFLLAGWIAMTVAVFYPDRSRESRFVWVGLGTGLLMGLTFSVIVATGVAEGDPQRLPRALAVQLAGGVATSVVLVIVWAVGLIRIRRAIAPPIWAGGLFLLCVLLLAVAMVFGPHVLLFPIVPVVMAVFVAAPASAAAFAGVGLLLYRWIPNDKPLNPTHWQLVLLTLILIVGLEAIALTIARLSALKLYRELPTQPPGSCFVATAAAASRRSERTGHRQLHTLRAFEATLMEQHPTLHAWLRKRYDLVGPRLAEVVSKRGHAEAAHVFLGPLAWVASRFTHRR